LLFQAAQLQEVFNPSVELFWLNKSGFSLTYSAEFRPQKAQWAASVPDAAIARNLVTLCRRLTETKRIYRSSKRRYRNPKADHLLNREGVNSELEKLELEIEDKIRVVVASMNEEIEGRAALLSFLEKKMSKLLQAWRE
jgi:hypothetical protein